MINLPWRIVKKTTNAASSDMSPSGQRRLGPITMAMFPVVIFVISWYCANSCRKASRYLESHMERTLLINREIIERKAETKRPCNVLQKGFSYFRVAL